MKCLGCHNELSDDPKVSIRRDKHKKGCYQRPQYVKAGLQILAKRACEIGVLHRALLPEYRKIPRFIKGHLLKFAYQLGMQESGPLLTDPDTA